MNSRLVKIVIGIIVVVILVSGFTYNTQPVTNGLPTESAQLMDSGTLKALGNKIELVSNSKERRGPCDAAWFNVKPSMGGEKVRRKMVALISCAVERWPVPGGIEKALQVAYCESGDHLWPWAHYDVPGDDAPFGCAGVFQHNTKYWVARVHEFLKPHWFAKSEWKNLQTLKGAYNARANVLVSIQMAHRGGWGPWSCA